MIKTEEIVKKINFVISEYVEKKIDENQLQRNLLQFRDIGIIERLLKTGNIPVVAILDRISEIDYYLHSEDKEGIKHLNTVIEYYYKEFKSGIPSYETKSELTYEYNSPKFYLKVAYNYDLKKD